ncbi:hypothetical protein H8356DRAFT_1337091 [Neocallimastix lanati (nom. inval.)]|nr:hypothetical protein H8356DRAFT_1345405 [Neocallimastix sp. JGI-2020a]KAG4082776.1 hypothetical protein H8356DRAFT_1337091 [Neocallimastix sp. JGI-2020a]
MNNQKNIIWAFFISFLSGRAIDCRSIGLRGRIFAFQANGPGSIPAGVYITI